MITTNEYWAINGVPLNTLAYNITTQSRRMQAPELRGDRVTELANRSGGIAHAMLPSARIFTFSMWVVGADEDGLVPTTHSQRAQFNANWQALFDLVYSEDSALTITRRRDTPLGTEVHTAEAWYVAGLDPTMTGNTRAEFDFDLILPDVWFEGSPVVASIPGTINVLGDVHTTDMVLSLSGFSNGARITNATNGWWVGREVGSGSTSLTINTKKWTVYSGGDTSYDYSYYISHGGGSSWFRLEPGANVITGVSGTVTYTPLFK